MMTPWRPTRRVKLLYAMARLNPIACRREKSYGTHKRTQAGVPQHGAPRHAHLSDDAGCDGWNRFADDSLLRGREHAAGHRESLQENGGYVRHGVHTAGRWTDARHGFAG